MPLAPARCPARAPAACHSMRRLGAWLGSRPALLAQQALRNSSTSIGSATSAASGAQRQPPRRAPPPPRRRPLRPEAAPAAAAVPTQRQQQQDRAPERTATLPPRPSGVTDGRWDRADGAAVAAALKDADRLARLEAKHGVGEVILGRSLEELAALAQRYGQPAYRGKQLRDAVLQGARSVADVGNVPLAWRAALAADGVRTGRSTAAGEVVAPDGTRKLLRQLADGLVVETVGIPADEAGRRRLTVCVSSQVGCPMRCTFCATGKGGYARGLLPHEIVDQVLAVAEAFGQRVTNVVYMGMGEPGLVVPQVLASHRILNTDLGIGARNITISTVGVPGSLARLAAARLQSTLAVSLHAPSQELRETIVPSARAYPLEALLQDCLLYFKETGRRVTFEYTLLSGVNDAPSHAAALAQLLRRYGVMRSHVNLIPWNPVDESEFNRPTRKAVGAFADALAAAGVPCSVRHTRGLEAAAACGQLRNRHQKQPLEEFSVPA